MHQITQLILDMMFHLPLTKSISDCFLMVWSIMRIMLLINVGMADLDGIVFFVLVIHHIDCFFYFTKHKVAMAIIRL